PPRKSAARRKLFAALADEPRTLVLLESPHRLSGTLADLAEILGAGRPAFLGRELTKLHEECLRSTLGDLAARFAAETPRGEIVLVVGGCVQPEAAGVASAAALRAEVDALVDAGTPEKEA